MQSIPVRYVLNIDVKKHITVFQFAFMMPNNTVYPCILYDNRTAWSTEQAALAVGDMLTKAIQIVNIVLAAYNMKIIEG
jgi:hypothetical protein